MDLKEKGVKISAAYLIGTSYFIAGIILLVVMAQSKYTPFHLGLIGTLNIIASYGIVRARKMWPYIVAYISLVSLIFGSINIAASAKLLNQNLIGALALSGIIAYTLLSLASLIHVAYARRKAA